MFDPYLSTGLLNL